MKLAIGYRLSAIFTLTGYNSKLKTENSKLLTLVHNHRRELAGKPLPGGVRQRADPLLEHKLHLATLLLAVGAWAQAALAAQLLRDLQASVGVEVHKALVRRPLCCAGVGAQKRTLERRKLEGRVVE